MSINLEKAVYAARNFALGFMRTKASEGVWTVESGMRWFYSLTIEMVKSLLGVVRILSRLGDRLNRSWRSCLGLMLSALIVMLGGPRPEPIGR